MTTIEREIDEDGYVIIEPLIEMDIGKKADVKTYNGVYHREYYRKILCVKVECQLCGCSVSKKNGRSSKIIKMPEVEGTE